jgi:DNA-binding response OmpR family regulator
MNIIVADDDKMLSKMICAVLNEGGHITVPAFDSMQTMMFVMKQPPDLVVLDINMPGGTGLDVLRKLKMSSRTKNVPVIILTGSNDEKLPEEVLKLGATQFLSKPIEPDVLLKAVRDAGR